MRFKKPGRHHVFRALYFAAVENMSQGKAGMPDLQDAKREFRLSPLVGRGSGIEQHDSIMLFVIGDMGMAEQDDIRLFIPERLQCTEGSGLSLAVTVDEADSRTVKGKTFFPAEAVPDLGRIGISVYTVDRRKALEREENLKRLPIPCMDDPVCRFKLIDQPGRQGFGHAGHMGVTQDHNLHAPSSKPSAPAI